MTEEELRAAEREVAQAVAEREYRRRHPQAWWIDDALRGHA